MGNDLDGLLSYAITPGVLAPEFDLTFYRRVQADLDKLDDDALLKHYIDFGKSEGRIASPAAHRTGFLAQIPRAAPTLEIGPAVRPSLRGEHVRYFEIADREGLIAQAIAGGYSIDNAPSAIHYVSATADLGIVCDRFESVFSSHCIEHQPDLVAHLNGVARILEPGGRYFLIVPDKRYCFDALLPVSTLDDVRAAYVAQRRVHTMRSVYEHAALTTHNDTEAHWRGNSEDPNLHLRPERAAAADRSYAEAAGGYVDVHAWQFTPDSFRNIMVEFPEISSTLTTERVYQTVYGRNEFCAVLRKLSSPR